MRRHPAPATRVALCALVALCTPAAVAAQSATSPLDRRIDSVFAAFSRTTTPGCAVGVDRSGAPLVRRAYGMANLESGSPFAVNTISESGSVAKQFVAAALVMLALDGVLSLDDDVTRWVPEVQGVGKRITVRQVLSHTSGLPDRYLLHEAQGRAAGEVDHPNAEVLDLVSRLRDLNFDPGEDYLYSNTGYIVAVAVLERASGRSLQAFTNERIFAPLGMSDTRWREDHRAVVPRRAAAYSGNANTGWRNEHPFTRVHGAGGLNVTVEDFLKWSAAFQTGAGRWRAIGDSMSAVIRLNEGTAITYGLGVTTDMWRGVKRISHTGSTGGYRAALYRFPDQAVSVALLCNSGAANPGGLATSVASIVLGEALAPAPASGVDVAPAIAIAPEALAAFAGRYHAPRTDDFIALEVRDGRLAPVGGTASLIPQGGDRFRMQGQQVEVRFSRTEGTLSMRQTAPGARAVDFVRVDGPVVSASAIAAFAGTYRSPELDAPVTLVAQGDTLMLDQGWRGKVRLNPIFRDGFELPGGERYRFTRDARGRITGFAVWAGRVRHLRFDRVTPR
jgi:CubicO group peptidase (beta-lactamase class C family)